jgi:hypothetical protein
MRKFLFVLMAVAISGLPTIASLALADDAATAPVDSVDKKKDDKACPKGKKAKKASKKTINGVVESVDAAAMKLVVKVGSGKKAKSEELAVGTAKVTKDGKDATLAEIVAGDKVVVKMDLTVDPAACSSVAAKTPKAPKAKKAKKAKKAAQ